MKSFLALPFVRYCHACAETYFSKEIPRAAAGLAYFLLLTLFPMFLCINAFLGVLQLDSTVILSLMSGLFPQTSLEIIETYLSYISGNQSGGLLFAGLLMVITTASAAFRSMMRAMEDIYERPRRKGVHGFVVSILFPLVLLVTIYLAIVMILMGDWVLTWLSVHVNLGFFIFFWKNLRFLILFLVFFLFVMMISRVSVSRDAPKAPIVVASMISSCALVASSVLFSWFISLSTRYSLVYGSLVSVVVMMVWLYLCSNILLAGNIIAKIWYDRKGRKGEQNSDLDL